MSRTGLLVLMCLGCHAPAQVHPAAPTPAAAPTDAASPVTPFARIETELSALRALPFKHSVPSSTQSRADFRAWVHGELGRELPPAKNQALSHAYADLGFAALGFDLVTTMEEAFTTQVAAYYDPKSKAFRVLGETRGQDVDEIIVAHELTHALDDQHFDLENFDGGEGNRLGLSEDERTAHQFVTEGEATFMMLAWRSASGEGAAKQLGPLGVAGVRMAVALLGAADPIELLAATRRGRSAAELSPEERSELDQMTKLPPVISMALVEPYFKGAALVSEVWGRGGWDAVNDLYRHPPTSTEQILHTREKFLDHRDPPIAITLPAARPALHDAPTATDVLGELGMRAYFKTWDFPSGDAAAAGWGGDRFWVWNRGGRFVVLWATRWDSESDAKKFLAAYLDTLEVRFPAARIEHAGQDAWRLIRPQGDLLHTERRGRDVDVIAGAQTEDIPELRAVLSAVERR
ncbi:MAG: hypothetical protein WCG85_00940 [Polyangia bacterium]